MANRLVQSLSSSNTNKSIRPTQLPTGLVVDVILDETHERLVKYEEAFKELFTDGKDAGFKVGAVVVQPYDDRISEPENLPIYLPEGSGLDFELPLIGEEVILTTIGGKKYYKRFPARTLNVGDARPEQIAGLYPEQNKEEKNQSYSSVSQTGTPTSNVSNSEEYKVGKYFEETPINKLKLYEGDRLIQSRFGQSIRFSGYNNEDKEFSPTIIFRNKQAEPETEIKEGDLIEEDIINDGSTIVLSSNKYKLPFVPGNRDVKVETAESAEYYEAPEELDGNQILINSDRIILSSKTQEMIFFSKGNISFISDGKFTLDNGQDGASIDLNGEYRTTTNDNDMYFLGGSGDIYLNTESQDEPLARGQTLIDILSEILDELQKEIHPTPAGPSSPPTNASAYAKIQSKLDTILSTQNFTE